MPFLKKQDKTLITLSKQVQRLVFREYFLNYIYFIFIKLIIIKKKPYMNILIFINSKQNINVLIYIQGHNVFKQV